MEMQRVLGANALVAAAHARGEYIIIVSNETTYEDVMRPGYWANHVAVFQTRPFARVEVVRQDGSMDLDLRCIEVKPGMVKMRCLRKFEGTQVEVSVPTPSRSDEPAPAGYKIMHLPNGAERGYAVQLVSTAGQAGPPTYLKKGLPDRAAAIAFAKAHKAEADQIAA